MTRLGYITFGLLLLILTGGGYFTYMYFTNSETDIEQKTETLPPPPPPDRVEELIIQSGETFGITLERAELDAKIANDIVIAALDKYDLANIRAGNIIRFTYDIETDKLKEILYEISSEEELFIVPAPDEAWSVVRKKIEYKIETARIEGSISTSLYDAALEQGADDAIVIELATVYQWTIDFGVDTKEGDTFNFIYEKRFRDGIYIDTGRVLAAEYTTRGNTHRAYFYGDVKDNTGYFDGNGASLKREFLKAPVAFKYITSGFTTGRRYIAAFNVSTGHRAIDYAAPYGTPVRSVGAGTVVTAWWNGSFGNFVSIRHNDTYTTNYAHMSRIRVSRGQKVSQGDIIGNVGSTGFSTGPHLHYEMVKFGVKINPLREEFPPQEPVREENLQNFQKVVTQYNNRLSS